MGLDDSILGQFDNESREEVLGDEPIDPKTSLSLDDSLLKGFDSPRGFASSFNIDPRWKIDVSKFERHMPAVHPEFGEPYLEKRRAAEQTGVEQFGGMLNQLLIGELVGGTIEGVGYLLDINQYGNLITGVEQDWGNWFSDIGIALKTWTEEATPVYRDPDAKAFDPGSWSWWMQNFKSVGSTLSLLIPAVGAVRGAGMLGKALGLTQKVMSGMFKTAKGFTQAKWMTRGISQAIVSRHMESMMECRGVMEEQLERNLSRGMSLEEAKKNASIAAASAYNKNWVMLLQDIPQYLLLNRAFGKGLGVKTIAETKALKLPLAPVVGQKSIAIGWDMLMEGGEEAYQYIVGEESKYLAELAMNPNLANSFKGRLKKYIGEGELWTNAWFGAIGAGVMQTAGRVINEAIVGKQKVKEIQNWVPLIRQHSEYLRMARDLGNPTMEQHSINQIWADIGQRAAQTGMIQNALDFVNILKDPSAEDLEEHGLTESDVSIIKEDYDSGIKAIERIGVLYNEALNRKHTPEFAGLIARNEWLLEKLNEDRVSTESKVNDLASRLVNYDKLTSRNREAIELDNAIQSIEAGLKFFEDYRDRTKGLRGSKEDKKLQDDIKTITDKLKLLITRRSKVEEEKTGEDKKNAKEYDITGAVKDEWEKETRRLGFIERQIASTQAAIKSYKKDEFVSDKVDDDVDAEVDISIEEDDIVLYTDAASGAQAYARIKDITAEDESAATQEIEDKRKEELAKTFPGRGTEEVIWEDKDFEEAAWQELRNMIVDEIAPNERQKISKYAKKLFEVKKPIDEIYKALNDKFDLTLKKGLAGIDLKRRKIINDKYDKQIIVLKDKLSKEDKEKVNPLYEIQLLDDAGNDTGESFVTSMDNIQLDLKVSEKFEESYEDGLKREVTSDQQAEMDQESDPGDFKAKVSYINFESILDDKGRVIGRERVVRNMLFDKFVSDPKNTLKGAKATFEIDFTTPTNYIKNFWTGKHHVAVKANIEKGILTEKEIEKIFTIKEGRERQINNLIDIIPILITVTAKGVKHTERLYLNNTFKQNPINGRAIRYWVVKNILLGNNPTITKITKNRGYANNVEDVFDVIETLKQDPNDIKLAVGIEGNIPWVSEDEILKGNLGPGNVAASTIKTANRGEHKIKLNRKKLSEEHADILFDAIVAATEKGQRGWENKFPDDRVENLFAGQVIRLLAYFGDRNTNLKHPNNKGVLPGYLIDKQLWVNRVRRELYFGDWEHAETSDGGVIMLDDKETLPQAKKAFIKWAIKNKNYVVSKKHKVLGIELNKEFKRKFRIGKENPIINEPDESGKYDKYSAYLLKNKLLTTDVQPYKGTESLFRSPIVELDFSKASTEFEVVPISTRVLTPTTPKISEKKITEKKVKGVKIVEENEKFGKRLGNVAEVTNPGHLKNLPIGSIVYTVRKSMDMYTKKETSSHDPEIEIIADIKNESGRAMKAMSQGPFYGTFVYVLKNTGNDPTDMLARQAIWEQLASNSKFPSDFVNVQFADEKEVDKGKPTIGKEDKVDETVDQKPVDEKSIPFDNTGDISCDDVMDEDEYIPREFTYTPKYEIMDLDAELKWFRKRTSHVKIELSDKLLGMAQDGKLAFALYTHWLIRLYKEAEVGTMYHELFHRVSLAYLSKEERETVWSEAKKRYKLAEDVTGKEVDDRLAEEFRQFVIDVKAGKTTIKKRTVPEFFRDLLDFIISLFTGRSKLRSYEIDRLFEAIYRGKFKFANLRLENADLYSLIGDVVAKEFKSVKLNTVHTNNQMVNLVKGLTEQLISVNKVEDLNNISDIKYKPLVERIQKWVNKFKGVKLNNERVLEEISSSNVTKKRIDELVKAYEKHGVNNETTLKQYIVNQIKLSGRLVPLYEEVLEKFGLFQEYIEEDLVELNIRRKEESIEDREDVVGVSGIEKYGKESFEVDSKDNVLASIKFLIATLHSSSRRDEFSNMFHFVDFSSTWSNLLTDLHAVNTVEEMIDKLKSKKDNYAYQRLARKLDKGSEILRSQFEVAVHFHKHSYLNVLYSRIKSNIGVDTYNFELNNPAISRIVNLIVFTWNETFYFSDFIIREKGKVHVIDGQKIKALINKYNKLTDDIVAEYGKKGFIEDTGSYKNRVISLLNQLYIGVDEATIDRVLEQGKKSYEENLIKFIRLDVKPIFKGTILDAVTGKLDETIGLIRLFSNEKSIRRLAQAYVDTHPDEITDMVIGPEGATFFVYAPNSWMTDKIREIKDDNKWVDKAEKSTINKYSRLTPLFRDEDVKQKLELLTDSGFFETSPFGRGDRGRKYKAISPVEDYIKKLFVSSRSIIPFPTIAGRGTYYYLKGIDKIRFEYGIEEGKLVIPEDIVDIFYRYALAEKERKEETELTLAEYNKATGDHKKMLEAKLVDNYHYLLLNRKKMTEFANGVMYQYFTSFNREGFVFDEKLVKDEIRKILEDRINDNLLKAQELGIITLKYKDGKLDNIINHLLPEDLVKEQAGAEMFANKAMAIQNIIADYTINSLSNNIEIINLFLGDPVFFAQDKQSKTTVEDLVKRLMIFTSSGDLLRKEVPGYGDFLQDSHYNVVTLATQEIHSIWHEELIEKHTKLYEDYLKRIRPEWAEGRISVEAKKLAKERLKGFKDVDSTDSQVYISPEMFRAISIRLGEWGDAKDKAFDLLQSDKELTLEEEQDLLNLVMQPLKLVNFSLISQDKLLIPTYDKMSLFTLFRRSVQGTQLEDLLDRMEKKGKYTKAKESIHMIKFDTAVKAGNRKTLDYFKDDLMTINDLNQFEVYRQPFADLRRQTVTDPHDVERTKTGTQFIKVCLANLIKGEYGKVYNFEGKDIDGEEIARIASKALVHLSRRGRRRLERKIYGRDGQIDEANFIKLLRKEARLAGLPDSVVDSLRMDGNDLYLQLDSFPNRSWTNSRVISLVNKHTIDVNLPGNQFIQASSFGIRHVDAKKGLKATLNRREQYIDWVKGATNELKFYRSSETGKTVAMEAIVSVNLFKHVIPNYKTLTFKQKKDWLRNNPHVLGYRIPTQGQNSVSVLRIVGFLPETVGDTIILPPEFTKLTGTDFDLDKLFVVRYNYQPSKRGGVKIIEFLTGDNTLKERYEKKIWELYHSSKDLFAEDFYEAVHKLNIDIHETRRELYEFNTQYGPAYDRLEKKYSKLDKSLDYVGNENERKVVLAEMKEIEDKITELDNQNRLRDELNEKYKEKENFRNLVHEHLVKHNLIPSSIEAFAKLDIYEQNTRQAIENRLINVYFSILLNEQHYTQISTPLGVHTSILKAKASTVRRLEGSDRKLSSLEFVSPDYQLDIKTKFMGGSEGIGPFALANVHHVLSQIVGLKYKSYIGIGNRDADGYTDLSQRYDQYGIVLITDWLSTLIDAHVDMEKDPYITDLNVNETTFSVLSLLLRAGVGEVSFDYLSQPILKELTKESTNYRGRLGRPEDRPVFTIRSKWEGKLKRLKGVDPDISDTALFDKESLQHDLDINNHDTYEFTKRQLAILDKFVSLDKAAGFLRDLTMASQIDTKRFGSNLVELRVFMNRIKQVYHDNMFINYEKLLPYDEETNTAPESDENTFLGEYLNNSILLSQKIYSGKVLSATTGFNNMYDKLLDLTKNKFSRDSNRLNVISDELFTYIASQFFSDPDGIAMNKDKLSKLFFGNTSMASLLIDIRRGLKHPEIKDNRIIRLLYSVPAEKADEPQFVALPRLRYGSKWERNDIMNDWEDLLDHKDPAVRQVGRMLILYSFYTSGFNQTIYSFFNFIPPKFMKELEIPNPNKKAKDPTVLVSYDDFIVDMLVIYNQHDLSDVGINRAIKEIYENNWWNKTFVPYVSSYFFINAVQTKLEKGHVRFGKVTAPNLQVGSTEDGSPIYKPYIRTTSASGLVTLMQYVGYDLKDKLPIYKGVDRKGYYSKGKVLKEYIAGPSMFPENIVPGKLPDDQTEERIAKAFPGFYYMPMESQIIAEYDIAPKVDEAEAYEEKIVVPVVSVQMRADNIAKILSGEKTTTIRSEEQSKDIGLLQGRIGRVVFNNVSFSIVNRGLLTVTEAGGKESMLKSEGVATVDDFKFQQTKDWINGAGKLYVYDIVKIPGQEVPAREEPVRSDPIPTSDKLSTPEKPIEVYTDGSDIKGTGLIGGGVYISYNDNDYIKSSPKTSENIREEFNIPEDEFKATKDKDKTFSNGMMETYSIYDALKSFEGFPEHLNIYSDGENSILQIKKMIDGVVQGYEGRAGNQSVNIHAKYMNPVIIDLIKGIQKVGGSVRIFKVKAHAGIVGNEMADGVAQKRERVDTVGNLIDSVYYQDYGEYEEDADIGGEYKEDIIRDIEKDFPEAVVKKPDEVDIGDKLVDKDGDILTVYEGKIPERKRDYLAEAESGEEGLTDAEAAFWAGDPEYEAAHAPERHFTLEPEYDEEGGPKRSPIFDVSRSWLVAEIRKGTFKYYTEKPAKEFKEQKYTPRDDYNQAVFDIENTEGLIERWRTEKDGSKQKVYNAWTHGVATRLAKEISTKYPNSTVQVIKIDKPGRRTAAWRPKVWVPVSLVGAQQRIPFDFSPGELRMLKGINKKIQINGNAISTLKYIRNQFPEYLDRYESDLLSIMQLIFDNAYKNKNLRINLVEPERFDKPTKTVMEYDPETHGVNVNISMLPKLDSVSDYIRALVHEIIHSFTYRALINPQDNLDLAFKKKITSLYTYARDRTTDPTMYGYKNSWEFVSEILTNENFADNVKDIVIEEVDKRNVLQKVIDAILEWLGFDAAFKVRDEILYNEAVAVITNYIIKKPEFTGWRGNKAVQKTIKESLASLFESHRDMARGEMGKHLDKVEEILEKVIKAMEHLTDLQRTQGRRLERQEADKILRQIAGDMDAGEQITAMITFVRESYRNINRTYREYLSIKEKGEGFDHRTLYKWRDSLSAYDMLEEYANLLTRELDTLKEHQAVYERLGLPNIKGLPKSLKTIIGEAIRKKNTLQEIYEVEGKDMTIDYLAPYYTKFYFDFKQATAQEYDKLPESEKSKMTIGDFINRALKENEKHLEDMTKAAIRQELEKASKDVGVLTRHFDNILDSRDPVVAAITKAFAFTHLKARADAILMADKMDEMTSELEKFYANKFFTSIRECYGFMIETDENGEPTQYYVTKWKSTLMNLYAIVRKAIAADADEFNEGDVLEELVGILGNTKKALPELKRIVQARKNVVVPNDIRIEIAMWRNQEAPRNEQTYMDGLSSFLKELADDDIISGEEITQVMRNANQPYRYQMSISDLIEDERIKLNSDAGERILDWMQETTWTYREPIDRWKNPQWNALEKILENPEDPRGKFYKFIVKIGREADKNVPYSARNYGRLPSVPKHFGERIKEGQGMLSIFRQSFKKAITIRPEDIEKGQAEILDQQNNPKYFLPVHYNAKMDAVDQSFDIATIYYKRWENANEYMHKSDILPQIEMAKFFVDKRVAIKRSPMGEIIKRITKAKDVRKTETPREATERKTKLAEQLHDWFIQVVYGKRQTDEGQFTLGKNIIIDRAKLADAINTYTAFNLLGANFVQGIANTILGESLQIAEAIAGEYMTRKNYTKANWYYMTNLAGIMGDVGRRRPLNVVNLIARKFDILHTSPGKEYRRASKFRQLNEFHTMFFTNDAGEHFMQNKFALGMLDTVVAYEKKTGKVLGSMLDMYYVDKKTKELKIKEEVDLERSKWSPHEQDAFGLLVKGILSRIHGEYSDLGRVAIQRSSLGRMGYMFRKFVVPGFKRRWEKDDWSERLGRYTEGSYISTVRFFKNFFKDLVRLKFKLMSTDWTTLSLKEKANIKRTVTEAFFLTGAIIAGNFALMKKTDTEDENEERFWSFMAYQMFRLKAELLFFTPKLDEAMSILRSPAATMSVLENLIKITGQITKPGDLYIRGPWKGRPKIYKTMVNFAPGIKQYYRARDIGEQINWFR